MVIEEQTKAEEQAMVSALEELKKLRLVKKELLNKKRLATYLKFEKTVEFLLSQGSTIEEASRILNCSTAKVSRTKKRMLESRKGGDLFNT